MNVKDLLMQKAEEWISRNLAAVGGGAGVILNIEGVDPNIRAICVAAIVVVYVGASYGLKIAEARRKPQEPQAPPA